VPVEAPADPEAPKLLGVEQVGAMLGKPKQSVYGLARRADWRPFTLRIDRRTLRFHEDGLRKWMANLVGE
jgi:hypothetical protein